MTRTSVGVEDAGPASFEELRVRDCSIKRTLDVIAEKWTVLVLRDALYGARPAKEIPAAHLFRHIRG
jgi:DNA-binding HxlR family transcriptional regulator